MLYHVLAILIIGIWGTTFVSTKVLLMEGLSPAEIFVLRFAVAYVGMAAVSRRLWCGSWKDEAWMMVAGLTGGSAYFLTENTALQYAQAGNVSIIVCLAPLLTAVLSVPVTRRRPSGWLWAASLLAFAGVAFVAGGTERSAAASHPLLGNLLALAAAALWAVYQLVVKPLADRYGAALLTRKVFGYGLLSALPLLLWQEDGMRAGGTLEALARPAVWGNLLFLGTLASLLCYFAWNVVVRRLGSVTSANYIYLNPFVTCLSSALLLGEKLTAPMMAGGAAIIVGVYMAVGRAHKGCPATAQPDAPAR